MRTIVQLALAAVLVLGGSWYLQRGSDAGGADREPAEAALNPGAGEATRDLATGAGDRAVPDEGSAAALEAFEDRAEGRQIRVAGRVQRLLADDLQGSRHQRFIIVTDRGQSLLVAHNIDLAPRLEGLRTGDSVSLYGEYEWNDQGGVMHWTHHDPQGSHVTGYIDWQGRRYQ